MTEPCYLHRDAFCCLVDEGMVFLNARQCEYVAVAAKRIPELECGIAGWNMTDHPSREYQHLDAGAEPSVLSALLQRGMLTTRPSDGKRLERIPLSARSALPSLPHRPHAPVLELADISHFMLALAHITLHLRRRNLLHLLRRIEAMKAVLGETRIRTEARDVGVLTRKFERLRVWSYSAYGACLKDSLVLADFLLTSGEISTFVIGVRSKPFAAHAWVQSSDVVLNDTIENVRRYTPILAI